MKKEVKKILFISIGIIGFCFFLFQSVDLVSAKDPDYPTKPITFNISFGAGGSTDLSSRAFCDAVSKYLGQPLIPVNRPGAGGTLTAMAVMTAKPDGYTLGTITPSSHIMAPFSDESPYKDLSGFTIISNFGSYIYPLMVRSDASWKNWKEFIEWAKKNPRGAKVASTGAKTVTSQGLVLSQVEKREQMEFIHISLKSSAECLSATLGGHVPMYGSTVDPATVPYIKEGKLRILSYQGINKFPGHEDVPSFQELYGFSIPNLLGVIGPKGLPDYVLKKLDDAFAKVVKDPDFISIMNRMYMPVLYMDRVQVNRYVEETLSKAGEIMKILKAEEAKEKK
jgi:tripartite-type tricarboxylate transporter receptor subunit TctC